MNRKRYIVIFTISIALVVGAVLVYLNQLSSTVSANLMTTVDEVSRHDVESIEGSLDNAYARLESVAVRMEVSGVTNMQEAQQKLNVEAASAEFFNAIYLLDADGVMYSSSFVRFAPEQHAYDEMFKDGREHFVMLYDDANGKLETTKESLIYGIRLDDMKIGGDTFVAMLARSDLSNIRDQLLIESFSGRGISSVVNSQGYYIVSASPATELSGRANFFDTLRSGTIEGGYTVEDVQNNIAEGKGFVMNFTQADGEGYIISFAPVEGTSWSFIMEVPMSVFQQRFTPFIYMTAGMLIVVVIVLIVMMAVLYRYMKRSVEANAEAAARAEFLSNMSHEIRTPLNGIIGLNNLMEHSLDDKEAMEGYVYKLGRAAQYLLSLVNDILDVSKLQAGKVELAEEPFDMRSVIDNVCEMQREPIRERGIEFRLSEDLPYPNLEGDEVRISQVLMNILSNAAKFTPERGTITLEARQEVVASAIVVGAMHGQSAESGKPSRVKTIISIADTGIGMTPEFQRDIFDAFTQERTKITQSQKGTGLGMAISNMLMQQMGGSLSVESELGRGSTFTVEVVLPTSSAVVQKAEKSALGTGKADGAKAKSAQSGASALPDAAEKSTSSPEKSGEIVHLLVAEDNELNSDIMSAILTREGYDVSLAANGQEAVDAFAASPEGHFAAVLMDAQMPVMDGYAAASRIRELDREDAKQVRIFACTASTFAEDRNRALDAGMDDFLAKPLDVPVMLRKLEEVRRGLE